MEPTVPTTGGDGNQEADIRPLLNSKPLHRFVQKEPRCLGIVILIFGCAELLMGFHLAGETIDTSSTFYVPFWQGALIVLCGNLSIYTEMHPSKKMVTVCLAMYVVSLLGTIVSVCFRIYCLGYIWYLRYRDRDEWEQNRLNLLACIECILFTSSLCVAAVLIFLCIFARFALKSTRTQVLVQCIPAPAPAPPESETPSD